MFVERNIKEAFERVNSFFPIVLVIGARQVGKSTFLRKVAEPLRKYVSLDPLDIQKQAREDPRLFLANNPAPVIFDEIQNIPELLPYIKAVVDEVRQTSPEKAKGMDANPRRFCLTTRCRAFLQNRPSKCSREFGAGRIPKSQRQIPIRTFGRRSSSLIFRPTLCATFVR